MSSSVTKALKSSRSDVVIVGAGLAGSECAWQLLRKGYRVSLIEQRPKRLSEAHTGPLFAELVCSNSLKSTDPESAPGLLKHELSRLDSLILSKAHEHRVPAGQSMAVEREGFARAVTKALESHPRLEIIREPVEHFEEVMVSGGMAGLRPVVIATGPLTGTSFAQSLQKLIGEQLYFYDAIAPIVAGESVNREIAFTQNRYDKVGDKFGDKASDKMGDESGAAGASDAANAAAGANDVPEGDYLNCPFSKEQYEAFIAALGAAEKVVPHEFEKAIYFQGCQPIEALLERGPLTLAHGPMKPVGLIDPRTGQQAYAVVQLRKEDSEGRAYNLVGFQTKLKYPEQKRIFAMIPGLETAEFYRYGSLHRNTYIHSPALLDDNFRLKGHPMIHFAGQITGVEGYLESTAVGALVGRYLALRLGGLASPPPPPATTALGGLANAIVNGRVKNFQPMNINWGVIPLNEINERDKEKKSKMVARAHRQLGHWLAMFGEA